MANFHKVGENYKVEGYVTTPNTMKLLAEHTKQVNGKVCFIKICRFKWYIEGTHTFSTGTKWYIAHWAC